MFTKLGCTPKYIGLSAIELATQFSADAAGRVARRSLVATGYGDTASTLANRAMTAFQNQPRDFRFGYRGRTAETFTAALKPRFKHK